MICIYLQSTKVTDQFMKMLLIIHVYIKIYIRLKIKRIYIYMYKRLKWFVKQHQVHKTK